MANATGHKSTRSDPGLTPESRLIYLYLLGDQRTKDADGKQLDTPRWELTALVPKLHSDPMQCPNYQMLAKHCMDAVIPQWGSFPAGGKWPVADGDVPITPRAPPPGTGAKQFDPEKYAYRRGHWVIQCSNVLNPGPRVCIMQNGQAIEIPARIVAGKTLYKSGDYGFVSLMAYTFLNKTFGVNFGFEGVLFSREGEAIGGQGGPRAAAAMFGGIAPVVAAGTAPSLPIPGQPGYASPTVPAGYAPQNPVPPQQAPAPPPPPPVAPAAPGPGHLPPFLSR